MCPFPEWDGESIRTGSLLRGLAGRHGVTLVTRVRDARERRALERQRPLFDEVHAFEFPQGTRADIALKLLGAPRWWRLPVRVAAFCFEEIGASLNSLTTSSRFDAVVLDHMALAYYLSYLPEGFDGLRILNLHNIDSILQHRAAGLMPSRAMRLAARADAVRMRRFEERVLGRFDAVFSASARESALLRARVPGLEIVEVPNGVARVPPVSGCARSGPSGRILFVGTLNYLPNEDGILWFIEEILPLVRARVGHAVLTIAGHRPTRRLRRAVSPGIELRESPEDLHDLYAAARVAIVPLRAGGGSRHKILEALAFQVPVVSTGMGAEGLDIQAGLHYSRAETAASFAESVAQTLEDGGEGAAQVARARPLILERYASDRIAGAAANRLAALASRRAIARQALVSGSACSAPAG